MYLRGNQHQIGLKERVYLRIFDDGNSETSNNKFVFKQIHEMRIFVHIRNTQLYLAHVLDIESGVII